MGLFLKDDEFFCVNCDVFRMQIQKKAQDAKLNTFCVIDAGRTQIASGSKTVVAIGPGTYRLPFVVSKSINSNFHILDLDQTIDQITGHLKLVS